MTSPSESFPSRGENRLFHQQEWTSPPWNIGRLLELDNVAPIDGRVHNPTPCAKDAPLTKNILEIVPYAEKIRKRFVRGAK